ncbi:MAG TPA: pyridoxal-phosphate dependent enzyme [Candidatus Limnocylindria bacterium]|nr:pyridoxal-phosphate dependent enzyme [Candidatus Limnocylindria bacterium]
MSGISLGDVQRARAIGAPHLHRTPMLSSRTLGARIGATAYLKAECFQRTGSFKPRGALFAVASLTGDQRRAGIVTMSAGNAAAAISYAASAVGVPVTVAMPQSAPRMKVDATRGYGGQVRFADDMTGVRALVASLQQETGAYFLHPYDDPAMITGHGSLGLEILDDLPDADVIVVGVGGGGLISGVAVAAAAVKKGIRIVGVEPAGAAAMRAALDEGRPVPLATLSTIADGLAAPVAGTLGLDIVRRLVEDVVVITDEEIVEGMRFLAERAKLVAEPAGAAAVGALLAGRVRVRQGEHVVAIVSGGNVDRARFAELVAG